MKRAEKLRALHSAFTGKTQGLKQYKQASRAPICLLIQQEPDNRYSIKPNITRPELPTGTLTELEYSRILEILNKHYEPVICIIRPLKKDAV